MRKLRRVGSKESDPLDGVANFFDLGVIFALGFMIPLMVRLAKPDAAAPATNSEAVTQHDSALSRDAQVPVERYRASHDPMTGEGERLGVAYRLATGEVVYVPDGKSAPAEPAPASR